VTALLLALSVSTAPDPELLRRLAAHDDRMERYLDAHRVTIHVDSTEGEVVLASARKNGQLHTTVVQAKDLEAEQKRAKERDAKNERTESPFARRNQGWYAFEVLGREGALLRIGFAPKDGPKEKVMVGQSLVDPEAGEVVRTTLKPSKLPPFVDKLDMILEYEARAPDAGRMLSKFVLDGRGGFLMFKREGRATMTFGYP
jgi:hypothetical protein